MAGYINLVVLENSERAIQLQKRWQAVADEHATDLGDDPGQCRWLNTELEGVALRLPAVWGTCWDLPDLIDTATGMAQEMHRVFGEDAPPFLATIHYDGEARVHGKVWWSIAENDHQWWESELQQPPDQSSEGMTFEKLLAAKRKGSARPAEKRRPNFILEQLEKAILNSDMAAAGAFRARLREERLVNRLPEQQTVPCKPVRM